MTAADDTVGPYAPSPLGGEWHRHGTSEPGWIEHSHLRGTFAHGHDPSTGFQTPLADSPEAVGVVTRVSWHAPEHSTCAESAEGCAVCAEIERAEVSAYDRGAAAERAKWLAHGAFTDIEKHPDTTDPGDWAEYAGNLRARLTVLRQDLLDGKP